MQLVGEAEGEDKAGQDGGALEDNELQVDRGRAGPAVRGAGDVMGTLLAHGGGLQVHVDDVRVILGHLRVADV